MRESKVHPKLCGPHCGPVLCYFSVQSHLSLCCGSFRYAKCTLWLKNRTLDIQVQIIFQNSLEISNETVYVSMIQISTSPQLCCHTALWNLKIKNYCQTHAASIKINIFLHETWQNLTTFRWYCQKKKCHRNKLLNFCAICNVQNADNVTAFRIDLWTETNYVKCMQQLTSSLSEGDSDVCSCYLLQSIYLISRPKEKWNDNVHLWYKHKLADVCAIRW